MMEPLGNTNATHWRSVLDRMLTSFVRARNCIGAIQKRLQHRNANVQLYALTVRTMSIHLKPAEELILGL